MDMPFIRLPTGEMLNASAIKSHDVQRKTVNEEILPPVDGQIHRVQRQDVVHTTLTITTLDGKTERLYDQEAEAALDILES